MCLHFVVCSVLMGTTVVVSICTRMSTTIVISIFAPPVLANQCPFLVNECSIFAAYLRFKETPWTTTYHHLQINGGEVICIETYRRGPFFWQARHWFKGKKVHYASVWKYLHCRGNLERDGWSRGGPKSIHDTKNWKHMSLSSLSLLKLFLAQCGILGVQEPTWLHGVLHWTWLLLTLLFKNKFFAYWTK